jgi:hypothetical protein
MNKPRNYLNEGYLIPTQSFHQGHQTRNFLAGFPQYTNVSFNCVNTERGLCSGRTLDLDCGGTRFRSRLDRRLSWMEEKRVSWLFFFRLGKFQKHTVAVSHRSLTSEARFWFQASQNGICGGHNGTGTSFSPSTSVSPVSIIPPTLHTHAFIYQRHYIISATDRVVT